VLPPGAGDPLAAAAGAAPGRPGQGQGHVPGGQGEQDQDDQPG
jgi:hypothetical protein